MEEILGYFIKNEIKYTVMIIFGLEKWSLPPLAMLYILLHTSVESWIQMVSTPIPFSLS